MPKTVPMPALGTGSDDEPRQAAVAADQGDEQCAGGRKAARPIATTAWAGSRLTRPRSALLDRHSRAGDDWREGGRPEPRDDLFSDSPAAAYPPRFAPARGRHP